MGRCCCGNFDLDPVYGAEITHNDYTHQILGPKGNFCGPAYLHLEKKLRARITELEAELARVKDENGNMDSAYQDRLLDFEARAQKAEAEVERLRKALEKIVSYCSDRHRVMMLGVQGFSTINEIAKAALREVDDGN